MNGLNKYWREARWDKNQPTRLAHIKEKRLKSMAKPAQGTVQAIKKERFKWPPQQLHAELSHKSPSGG